MSFYGSTGWTRLDRVLDSAGDGTGTKNANVDGSGTPVMFKILPPSVGSLVLTRMIIMIQDNGSFTASRYGAIVGGISNGIQVGRFAISDDSLQEDYLDGLPIQNNADWTRAMFDVEVKSWGAGDEFLTARWTFAKAGPEIILRSDDANYFGIHVRDDLSSIVQQHFTVQGYSVDV